MASIVVIWLHTWQDNGQLCSSIQHALHHQAHWLCVLKLILLTQKHLVSIKNLCLQSDFCEEFDAVAAANAGKPVMLTGE